MIELSNFDLSTIKGKLNQGVTKTSSGQGSEFEEIFSAQLGLSGSKSGKDSPLLNQRGETTVQNISDGELRQLAAEGVSDLSTLVKSKVDGRQWRGSELLPTQDISLHEIERIELIKTPADRVGEMLSKLPMATEQLSEMDASKASSLISFSLQPAEYFFDIEPSEKHQIVTFSAPKPDTLSLRNEKLLPEASIMDEIAEVIDPNLRLVDGAKESSNSHLANILNTQVIEFTSPQSQSAANRKSQDQSNEIRARISPKSSDLFALIIEDPDTAAFLGDREGNSTEKVLIPATALRGEDRGKNRSALLGATSVVTKEIQEFDPASKIFPQLKSELTDAATSSFSGMKTTSRGEKIERVISDEASTKQGTVATVKEAAATNSQSDALSAAVTRIIRNKNIYERQIDGHATKRESSIEYRSQSPEARSGPYIETLSGQRQVLVGGRPSRYTMADPASESEASARVDETSTRTILRKSDLPFPSTTKLAMTRGIDMQSLKPQEEVVGLSGEYQSQTRARLKKSRAAYSGIRETGGAQPQAVESRIASQGMVKNVSKAQEMDITLAGSGIRETGGAQPQAVESRIASQGMVKNFSKAQEVDITLAGVRSEVESEASTGRISELLSMNSENRGGIKSASILQPAELIAPSAFQEGQPAEGMAKRVGPNSIQAELDLSGYDHRRELLSEELDKRVGQLIRSVSSQIKAGQPNELQIKLHPRELGIITFGVELLDGNDISVKILNASEEATKLVKEYWPSHWQDGGAKVSNIEAGERGLSGNKSDPNPDRKEGHNNNGASKDGGDSLGWVAERDLDQGPAENEHNIDITI
jgi:hypothetical protein